MTFRREHYGWCDGCEEEKYDVHPEEVSFHLWRQFCNPCRVRRAALLDGWVEPDPDPEPGL